MKKICVVLVLVLILCNIAGCSGQSQTGEPATTKNVKQDTSSEKKNITGTISVSMGDRYLQEAAQKFEKLHPGVKVEFKELKTENGVTSELYEQLINRMNTEIMSGKGADIIVLLPWMPYKKYISRQILVDLNQMMKSDQNYAPSQYYTNIFAGVKYNNKIYTLPVSYSYNLLGSDTKLNVDDRQWNWQDLAKTIERTAGNDWRYALQFSDEGLLRTIIRHDYSRFVNDKKKSASFNSQEFISLLNLCKNLSDKGYIRKSVEKPTHDESKTLFKDIMVSSLLDLAWTQTPLDPDISAKYLYRYPSQSRENGTFQTGTMYAINSASPNQNTAWEFLKFLISEDMQSSSALYGFPVNKSAYKQIVANQSNQFRKDKQISLSEEQKDTLMQKYAHFNEEIVQDLKIYSEPDPRIIEFIAKEAHPFFAGQSSAENVAQKIQNKVEFYLHE